MDGSIGVDSVLADSSESARPGSARSQPVVSSESDPSARARSLQLLKKKLGVSATRRSKGSTDAVLPPSPPPLPKRPMDSLEGQTLEGQRSALSLTGLGSHNGHENPATNQGGEEALTHEPDEIPIPALKQQALFLVKKRGGKRPSSDVSRPASSSSNRDTEGTQTPLYQPHREPRVISKTMIKWSCRTCQRECIPIREESRCLCGHRYKEHPSSASDPRVKNAAGFRTFACTSAKCACPAFFYIVAEGAWVLRCRCKHKHVDHDASRGAPFACKKPKCSCLAFDSPWICNCDHPWADHAQEVVTKQLRHPLELMQQPGDLDELTTVLRTDLLAEPLQLRL